MADETVVPVTTEATATTEKTQADASAATKNTEPTTAEVMIPKSRLDEVLAKLKNFESESAKSAKAAKDAETLRLTEEGKYKELFEKQQADLSAAQQLAKASETRLLQRDVAAKTNLPLPLADRLRGETEDEMIADAKAIIAVLPKQAAPNINANNGAGGAPAAGALSDAEIAEKAARYGVSAVAYKAQLAKQ